VPAGQTGLATAATRATGACQAGPVTDTTIRDAAAADTEAIGRIALATGQDEEWSGSDPAYVRHLLAHGRLVVAGYRGAVAGFGATLRIGTGPAAITMLCDLFVDPRFHGLGLGQAMLGVLWHDGTPRITFSSLHAHALPLYARYGLDAWWPLLYLSGDVRALPAPAGWAVAPASAGQVADLERQWTGIDRTADHEAWAALVKAGFGASDDPVMVKGVSVRPLDVLQAVIDRNIARNRDRIPPQESHEIHFAIGEGTAAGHRTRVTCRVIGHPNPLYDDYADAGTSMNMSIGVQQILSKPLRPGVWAAEEYFEAKKFFSDLRKRHFEIEIETQTLEEM